MILGLLEMKRLLSWPLACPCILIDRQGSDDLSFYNDCRCHCHASHPSLSVRCCHTHSTSLASRQYRCAYCTPPFDFDDWHPPPWHLDPWRVLAMSYYTYALSSLPRTVACTGREFGQLP